MNSKLQIQLKLSRRSFIWKAIMINDKGLPTQRNVFMEADHSTNLAKHNNDCIAYQ